MSDNEQSDGLEELQDLLNDYKDEEAVEDNIEGDDDEEDVTTIKQEVSENSIKMEKVIFGDKAGLLRNMAKAVESHESENESRKAQKRKPVWADEDDEEISVGEVKLETKRTGPRDYLKKDKAYKDFLTQRFERIVGAQPKWAKLEQKEQQTLLDSDDEELLRTVGFLEKPTGTVLQPSHLAYKHLKPLNRDTDKAEGQIISIQFHPTSSAALVASQNGFATIYGVDGRKNEKLHSMHFKKFPLTCVQMTPCGTKAFFGSYKPHYYVYDLMTAKETRFILPREVGRLLNFQLSPCGKFMTVGGRGGELHLFDANAQELIYTFKQENRVAGIRFTGDSKRIICNSNSSNVSIFSLSTRRLEHSFNDDGCIKGSVLDLSPNQRLLATGSREGVVNVYDFENVQTTATPQPVKSFLNLTTGISDVKFNHSSELLAMISGEVNDAVKLGHFPSGTVFSNFPEFKPGLGAIRTVEFSPGSGYIALGSRNRTVPLYRLKHFNNY